MPGDVSDRTHRAEARTQAKGPVNRDRFVAARMAGKFKSNKELSHG